jgi:putative hydrolase of the HAD superfamily
MIIKADYNSYFVFDLDDTLYPEIDYLKSAYYEICNDLVPRKTLNLYNEMLDIHFSGGNAFNFLLEKFPAKKLSLEKLLYLYRNHNPKISLREGALEMLKEIKKKNGKTGIITDGRSITQRNKIQALGLENIIDKLLISGEFGFEKPASVLYESFMDKEVERQYYYLGDNLVKDFVAPKKLGWYCIGILDDKNIRKQNISEFSDEFLPHIFINKFTEIGII